MDEISNIVNFNVNKNRPTLDNCEMISNEVLNESHENKLSTVEHTTFFQSNLLIEKQLLASVNNNCQNEKANSSFALAEYSATIASNNFEENITILRPEVGTTADNINGLDFIHETAAITENGNSLSKNLSLGEVPVGNAPPDVSPDKNCKDIQGTNAEHCNEISLSNVEKDSVSIDTVELKDVENDSVSIDTVELKGNSCKVPDLVEFSFNEQKNAGVLLGNSAFIDSVFEDPVTSPNSTFEETSGVDSAVQANKSLNSLSELFKIKCVIDVPNDTDSMKKILIDGLCNTDSSRNMSENFDKKVVDNIKVTGDASLELENQDKTIEEASEVESMDDSFLANKYREVNDSKIVSQVSENPIDKSVEFSPLTVEKVSSEMSVKSIGQFSDPDFAFKLPENLCSNKQDEFSPLKVKKTSFDTSNKPDDQFSESNSALGMPCNEQDGLSPLKVDKISFEMSDKSIKPSSDPDFESELPENLCSNKQGEFSPLKVEKASFDTSDKPDDQFSESNSALGMPCNEQDGLSPLKVEKVSFEMPDKSIEYSSNPDFAFKLPENFCNNEQDEFSPLKLEKVSFGTSDEPDDKFFESDPASRLPEMPNNKQDGLSHLKVEKDSFDISDKPLEKYSDPDFVFKVPEIPLANPLVQFGDPELSSKVSETTSNNEGDEQFVDAVQFFRDPNSFQFLENIRTSSAKSGSPVPRSSLYVNFDPLHSKIQTNVPRPDNCELISAAVQENNTCNEKCSPEIVNKQLVDVAARESLGNILISFDSPKSTTCTDTKIATHIPSPAKMITAEQLQQRLKIHELETQEAYLKKQREMEMEVSRRDKLLKSQHIVIEEIYGFSVGLSADIRKNQEKIASLKEENEKLKEDLKTSAEDLQSVENTFTDFYKRYEQCKGMLKTYKDNEEHLKQTTLDLQIKAKEQEQMYNMLQERTEEMLEKANIEVDNAKRSGEAQVIVLKAQLKKAEMKISSLESDIKQIKIENSQLDDICGDLMAKVSRS